MKYTKTLGSIALSALLLGMTGCGSDNNTVVADTPVVDTPVVIADTPVTELSSDQAAIIALEEASAAAVAASLVGLEAGDEIPFGDGSFSPFERVAVFPTVKDANGNLDHVATYAKVAELANTLAKHVANVDEPGTDPDTFKGANWILAGLESSTATNTFEDENVSHHILGIPTKLPIDPSVALSPANTKKVKVVEVCNSTYAAKALGVKKVGGETWGAVVPHGIYHTTALPCEITIYNDENAIYVDMLNPETIFTLFFTEVFSSAEMDNLNFATEMLALPTKVKSEIFAMIYNAFDTNNETYTKTAIKMGTIYSSMSKAVATTDTANDGKEPYRHYSYTGDGTEFTSTDAKKIAAKIISVMTSDEEGTVGVQEADLLDILPSTDAGKTPMWRSGRLEPLKVPGGSWIIEACSPTYAKEALSTGEYHTPALPCEVAVFVNPDDNQTIDISILNPEFMFGALFADGMVDLNSTQIAEFNAIIDNINGDLKAIVDYAVDNNISELVDGQVDNKIEPIDYSNQ